MSDASAAEIRSFNPDKPVTLPGRKCAYCGCDLKRRTATSDHVVARNFVPEGTLANGFHLQVRACRPCNDKKARLENDISIITMLPDTAGRYAREDERLIRTVARKGKGAISPATRKLAAQSYNKVSVSYPVGSVGVLDYNGMAMPTLDEQRVARLAYYHVQGFCFFRSFDRERRHGQWLSPARFQVLGQLFDADWGNPRLRHFAEETSHWERVCTMIFADGYFKHAMFKRTNTDLWAWVLEWNNRLRVFGIYGGTAERDAFASEMPIPRADISVGDSINGFAIRFDTPLSEHENDIFAIPEIFEELSFAAPHWR